MITHLNDNDIGAWIYYVPSYAKNNPIEWQRGRIKSFRNKDQIAFVVYATNDDWDNYRDYTGASTRYEDLVWQ